LIILQQKQPNHHPFSPNHQKKEEEERDDEFDLIWKSINEYFSTLNPIFSSSTISS